MVEDVLDDLCDRSAWLSRFRALLGERTGETLLGRIDHLALPGKRHAEPLGKAGFVSGPVHDREHAVVCPTAAAPPIFLYEQGRARCVLAVDSVAAFVEHYPDADPGWRIEQRAGAPLRVCQVAGEREVEVWVAERSDSIQWPTRANALYDVDAGRRHLDAFRTRSRDEAAKADERLVDLSGDLRRAFGEAAGDLGSDWATALFFRSEREYWLSQTPAAQVQGERQDALGLGWANHDHHTYRCSRRWFGEAVAMLELLGLERREAFHAGAEAGWGAQILEHPRLPIVAFVDVDLSPAELEHARGALAPGESLGTVGLWCELHGEAMFQAGLHHLACRYDFAATCAQLHARGVDVMPPFTDLPELTQAFTTASRRPVPLERVESLEAQKLITPEEAERFGREGARGSHLELIERRQAYKGFHPQGINVIICETDPRS